MEEAAVVQQAALLCSDVGMNFASMLPRVLRPRVAFQIENVDFSQPVVAEMCRTHSTARPGMVWRVMDVTDMSG